MNAPLSFRFYAPLSSTGVGFGRIRSFSSPFPKGSRAWFNRAFPPFERGDDQAHVVERRLAVSTPKALHVLLQHEVVDMIHFVLAYSRQGKVRISKWYPMPSTERGSHREEMQGKGMLLSQKEKKKAIQEIADMVLERTSKMCNFLEWKDYTLVYKRFAGLYFILGIDREDNELLALEFIQHWVETLDKYFGSVCELDLIFHFHKAYFILDELVVGGHYGEPSKSMVCNSMEHQDELSDSQSMPGVFAGS